MTASPADRSSRPARGALLAALVALLIAACGGDTAAPRPTPKPSPSPSPSPSASPSPTALPPLSVEGVITAAKAIGLPISDVVVYTAESDPDRLLGRPNQYTARAIWHDSRLAPGTAPPQDGGALEVFASPDDLHTRIRALAATTTPEYDYSSDSGPILLRLSRQLTTEQAGQYAQALRLVLPDLKGPG